MIRKDLEAAGIPYTTKDGDADFHAAGRHTHITELLRNGASDEHGILTAGDAVHTHDLNATMLHCLGLDHTRLTYPFQGLDQRLTGVEEAHVIDALLA